MRDRARCPRSRCTAASLCAGRASAAPAPAGLRTATSSREAPTAEMGPQQPLLQGLWQRLAVWRKLHRRASASDRRPPTIISRRAAAANARHGLSVNPPSTCREPGRYYATATKWVSTFCASSAAGGQPVLTHQRNPPGLTLGILLSQKTANDYCSQGIESVTELNAMPQFSCGHLLCLSVLCA